MYPELTTSSDMYWEHYRFVYPLWKMKNKWVTLTLGDDRQQSCALARQFFWQFYESEITSELQRLQNDGWELLEAPSPGGLKLRSSEHFQKHFDIADVVMWIASLGMAFLVSLLLDEPVRHYVVYEPAEFGILMRRPSVGQCASH